MIIIIIDMNRKSSVTHYGADDQTSILERGWCFLFVTNFRTALFPNQPPIRRKPVAFLQEVKWLKHEVWSLSGSITSTPHVLVHDVIFGPEITFTIVNTTTYNF